MLDILQQFLASNTTPQLKESIEVAHKLLDELGAENLDEGFEQILMMDDVSDHGATIQAVIDLTTSLQHDMLRQHAVTLKADTPIRTLTDVLRGIMLIQEYEDTEAILRICLDGHHPNEVFADIMALVTAKSSDNMLLAIESVSGAMISRISDIVSATDDELISDEERLERAKYLHDLRRFIHYMRLDRDMRVSVMIADGQSVGYPFTVYADQIGRDFEGLLPEVIAREMVAMALISSDGKDKVRSIIKENIERYVADLRTITKVDIEVNRLMQGFVS